MSDLDKDKLALQQYLNQAHRVKTSASTTESADACRCAQCTYRASTMDSNATPGNGDPRDTNKSGRRRRTISGDTPAHAKVMHKKDGVKPLDAMRFPLGVSSAPSSPTKLTHTATSSPESPPPPKTSRRRRAISGSFFSKFNILRSGSGAAGAEGARPASREQEVQNSPAKSISGKKDVEESVPLAQVGDYEHSREAALRQSSRKRKGSLRKTALLGGRKTTAERREKGEIEYPSPQKNVEEQTLVKEDNNQAMTSESEVVPGSAAAGNARKPPSVKWRHGYDNAHAASSSESGYSESAAVTQARLSLFTLQPSQDSKPRASDELSSPVDVKSPTSQTSYTSTTSEDDLLTLLRPLKPLPSQTSINNSAVTSSPSYFSSSAISLPNRHHSSKRSPLSRTLPLPLPNTSNLLPLPDEPHDYTLTESWGWLLLIVTWITFIVGMGSCLGIWSWAWDVGVTPYAPEELEDDETLPIVGYYPALMVLSGVVAWGWITVAWVGMKYFKHAPSV